MASRISFSYSKQEQRHRKYKERSAILRIVVTLLVIISFAVVVVDISNQSREMRRLELENRDLVEELALVEQRQQEIHDLEKKIDTNEFIEQIARDELGLVTPDEYIFVED